MTTAERPLIVDPEVRELLPDQADLFALADAVAATQTVQHRRSRIVLPLIAATLAAGAAAVLVLTAPWRGGPSFTQQALAAVGNGRYVHAVFQTSQPYYRLFDLSTGRSRPSVYAEVVVYDTRSGAYRSAHLFNGVAFAQGSFTSGRRMACPPPPRDPAVTHFVSGYRDALRSGEARVAGETTVDGRKAKIIRFPLRFRLPRSLGGGLDTYPFSKHPAFEDVAVAADSRSPLWIRIAMRRFDPRTRSYSGPIVASPCPCERVASIRSSEERPALPRPARAPRELQGEATSIRRIDPADASTALEHTALWVARTFGRQVLKRVRFQRLTHWSNGATRVIWAHPNEHGIPGLRFDYRGPRGWLEIDETTRPEPGYGFGTALSPPAQTTLECQCEAKDAPEYGVWSIHLRKGGLFVQIRSSGRDVAIKAARSLVPIR